MDGFRRVRRLESATLLWCGVMALALFVACAPRARGSITVEAGEEIDLGSGFGMICPDGWQGELYPANDETAAGVTLSVSTLQLHPVKDAGANVILVYVFLPESRPGQVPDPRDDYATSSPASVDIPWASSALLLDARKGNETRLKLNALPRGGRAWLSIGFYLDEQEIASVVHGKITPDDRAQVLLDYLSLSYAPPE